MGRVIQLQIPTVQSVRKRLYLFHKFCCLVGAILKILCPRQRRVFQSKLGVSSSNQCNLHHSPHTGHLEKKRVQSFSDTCILAGWRNHVTQLFSVHGVNDVWQTEVNEAGARTIRSEIHTLINYIWNQEEFSEECKEFIFVPLYKKGDQTDCSNYRGLSILSTTYKILSNIPLSRLTPYAEETIGDHQCGFRRNRSTTDHIFCIRQILFKKCESMQQCISCLQTERQRMIQLRGRNCVIF